jgi:hypothetical protein
MINLAYVALRQTQASQNMLHENKSSELERISQLQKSTLERFS